MFEPHKAAFARDHANTVLRTPEVTSLTGLSRSTIYRLMGDGSFPRQRKLGPNSVGWLHGEIANWINSRPMVHT
ncbi:hypothetical protein BRX37_16460 [Sphingomonas sp. S-NIH.Pt3_0716]|nr:hypothetical protein BRX37_16460 [Sphingomonas sp. S-NIH.Pt3_0716]